MKKTYSAPVMDIEKFDVIDVITVSGGTVEPKNVLNDTPVDEQVALEW